MKLLFIIHSLKYGGAERQLVELIKGLDKKKYDLHLICLENTTNGYIGLLQNEPIKLRYFPRSSKYDLIPVYSIYRYMKANKIDLVHTFESLGSLFGLLAAKLYRRQVICSAIRDAKDKNIKIRVSKKIIAKFADVIIANSQAGFKNRFKNMKPHFRIIYNGVDFRRFQQKSDDSSKIKNNLGVNKFRNVIGMVASLSEKKDHDTLLDAAPNILQNFPDTCFLIVGDGEKRITLSEKAKILGLKDNVFFLGYRDDVERIIKIFDVLALLTNNDVHLEGISNAIIEAMALGVPVVASQGGGTDELINHGVNGILVPAKSKQETADAIVMLLKDKREAKRLANAAMVSVRKIFNLERYTKEYEDIYQEMRQDRKL